MIQISTVDDLNTLASVLASASETHLMALEHAKSIWKEALKKSGLDVAKPTFEKKGEDKKV